MHKPPYAGVAGRSGQIAGPVGVHLVELADPLGMDHAGGVDDVGIGAHLVHQASGGIRSRDVADEDVDPPRGEPALVGDELPQRIGLGGAVRQQTEMTSPRVGQQAVHHGAAQPTGGTGHDCDGRRRPPVDVCTRRAGG